MFSSSSSFSGHPLNCNRTISPDVSWLFLALPALFLHPQNPHVFLLCGHILLSIPGHSRLCSHLSPSCCRFPSWCCLLRLTPDLRSAHVIPFLLSTCTPQVSFATAGDFGFLLQFPRVSLKSFWFFRPLFPIWPIAAAAVAGVIFGASPMRTSSPFFPLYIPKAFVFFCWDPSPRFACCRRPPCNHVNSTFFPNKS